MRLGGGMVDSNGWNWHHQIGPRELRPPNMCGVWDSVMSNGWGVFDFLNLMEELRIRPVQHYYDLGLFSSYLPNSNHTFCMLNRQRKLTLLRLTETPTANSSA